MLITINIHIDTEKKNGFVSKLEFGFLMISYHTTSIVLKVIAIMTRNKNKKTSNKQQVPP